MKKDGQARAMRAEGHSFVSISRELGISLQWAYKLAGDVDTNLLPTAGTIIKHHGHNGGCSTLSGLIPISMPRITALHGAMA